jgi:hypothetical protein
LSSTSFYSINYRRQNGDAVMDERQRTILQDVADGRLSPEEAAQLLDEAQEADADERPDGPSEQRSSTSTAGIQRVRLVQSFRAARVVGDPDVAEAVVEGPHVVEREGDVLVVHGDEGPGPYGFAFSRGDRPWYPSRPERPERPGRGRGGENANWWAGSWGSPSGWVGRWGLADAFRRIAEELTVRMRPDLALDADVTAGSLKVAGMIGPLRIAVSGGAASLDRFRGPLDLSVEAGSVKGSGVLAAGSSRIHCQAGSVKLNLERGSSVRIRARTELGKLLLPGDPNWIAGAEAAREVTVGDGEALLEIEASMGSVVVSADR